ncbi:hypothetical protein ACHAQA_007762 [Verticillium albo-atrum]
MSTARNMRPTTPNLKIARGAAGGGGNSHQFSYVRSANRFAQLSPQSSSEDEEDEDDDDEEEGESDVESTETDLPRSSSEEEDDEEEEDEDEEDEEDDDEHIVLASPVITQRQVILNNVNINDDDDDEDDTEEEDDDSDSDSDEDMLEADAAPQVMPDLMHAPEPPTERIITTTTTTTTTTTIATFTVEELSDFDPMDDNRIGVIPPTSFEYPDSDRSRSRSRGGRSTASDAAAPKSHPHLSHRPHPDLDINMMHHLRNLNCSGSDEEDDMFDPSDDAAHKEFVLAQRALKMRKRRSHGSSIGKRTHSERSDSDGKEDLPDTPWDAVGASARRLRRRVGDRRSLQFQDPPPERIEELEEPDSCEEGRGRMMRGFGMLFGDGETLARELPYYAMEIMEMEEDE